VEIGKDLYKGEKRKRERVPPDVMNFRELRRLQNNNCF